MPIGFFYMAGGWAMIIAGIAAVPIGVYAARDWEGRRFLLTGVVAVLAAGALLLGNDVCGSRRCPGYTTALGETAALALIGSSFRSPPVSVWLDSGSDLTGLILGYRMEVRYWPVSYTHLTLPTIYSV